jgi:hypothetical protein
MLVFMIDSIHVMFGGLVLQQRVGIHMGSNCAPLPQPPLSVHQLRLRNSCVECREVKYLNAIEGGEEPRLYESTSDSTHSSSS